MERRGVDHMTIERGIAACRPRHTQSLPGLFCTHITRTECNHTLSPADNIFVHRRTYSVQCSDKVRLPQLRIKCGIAKSCPGTHNLCRHLWEEVSKNNHMTYLREDRWLPYQNLILLFPLIPNYMHTHTHTHTHTCTHCTYYRLLFFFTIWSRCKKSIVGVQFGGYYEV